MSDNGTSHGSKSLALHAERRRIASDGSSAGRALIPIMRQSRPIFLLSRAIFDVIPARVSSIPVVQDSTPARSHIRHDFWTDCLPDSKPPHFAHCIFSGAFH
jgi:hypothetical protein